MKVKVFVGAGGKTTFIKAKAQEYRKQGLRVFVTTTTHMWIEEDTLLTDDAEVIIDKLKRDGYVMAGLPSGHKFTALSPETYYAVCACADVVLVEGDGSKHMPIKFPNSREPVIPDNADEILVVCGLYALGKPAFQVAHRLELVKDCLQISDDTVITDRHMEELVCKGYLQPLRARFPEKKIKVLPSFNDSAEQKLVARRLRAL